MPSPNEVFTEINNRLAANPAKTAGLNASYAFDLSGDEGGPYHIVLADGTGKAGPGT